VDWSRGTRIDTIARRNALLNVPNEFIGIRKVPLALLKGFEWRYALCSRERLTTLLPIGCSLKRL
jgi:hypothetical protein